MNDDTNTNDNRDLGEQGLKHQGQGALDNLTGKVQEVVGNFTGDKGDQLQGKLKQGKGNVEQGVGQAETNIDSALEH